MHPVSMHLNAASAGQVAVCLVTLAVLAAVAYRVTARRAERRGYDRGYDDGFAVARRLFSGRPSRQPIPYRSTHPPVAHPPLDDDATDGAEEGHHPHYPSPDAGWS